MFKYAALAFLILVMFSINNLNVLLARNPLNMSASTAPSIVKAGQNTIIILLLKYDTTNDTDALPITIYSIQIKNPSWATKEVLDRPVQIEQNRIYDNNIPITVPENTNAGEYSFILFANTSTGDYVASTDLEELRIEDIPLTGNIPLSVLVLII